MLLGYQLKNMTESGEPKRIIQQVPTRWNSTFFMFRRFILLKEAVKHCMALIEREWPVINSEDWEIMEQVCKVLQPFEEITSSVSGDKYLTGSMTIVMTNCFKDICEDLNKEEYCSSFNQAVIDVIRSLKYGLKDRFQGIEHSKTFEVCTLLDPRFKLVCFKNDNAVSELKKYVQGLIIGLINNNRILEASPDTVQENSSANLSAWDKLDDLIKKISHKEVLKQELYVSCKCTLMTRCFLEKTLMVTGIAPHSGGEITK